MERILITGASGFIGSFLVEEALKRGMEVYAGVRKSSSRRYLQDARIRFVELNFASRSALVQTLSAQLSQCGKFDYIVHCAGVTKCPHAETFTKVNYDYTVNFTEALREAGMMPRQFIYISTLSVFGAVHEADYAPITESDVPVPNTAYGQSKLKAETYLRAFPGLPYVIFRPTGVYGPRETDYYLMAKSIRNHVDFAVGYKRQDLTFVYVRDVVQAGYLAIDKGVTQRCYFLSDGQVYSSRDFSDLIQRGLGNPFVLHLRFPLLLLKAVSFLGQCVSNITGRGVTLNLDKYKIMKQRNWRCDISPAVKELGYSPAYLLERGVRETLDWYKSEGWL